MKTRIRYYSLVLGSMALFLTGLPNAAVAGPANVEPYQTALRFSIGINTSEGFSEMIPAGKKLPTVYSETFSNYKDDQESVALDLFQKLPEGVEKITDLRVPIPKKPKATVRVVVTLRINAQRQLIIKATVMDSTLVQEFGPFPVQ